MTREERLFNIMISVGRGVWLLDESRQLICSISLSLSPAATRAQLLERRAAGLITVSYLNLSLSPQHYTSVSHIYSLLGLKREARRRTNCWTGTESVAGGYCGEVLSDGRRHINVSESEEAVTQWASHHHQDDGSRDGEVEPALPCRRGGRKWRVWLYFVVSLLGSLLAVIVIPRRYSLCFRPH